MTAENSAPSGTADRAPHRARAVGFFLLLSLAAMISQFFRSAIGVIAPELQVELSLAPDQLGYLSSAFFLAFAALQLPVGVMLDRFGARLTISVLMAVAVVGALTFSLAEGFAGLVVGQMIMGAGFAGVFMGAIVVLARWFSEQQFPLVSGFMLAASNGGMVLSATPLAWAAEQIGWRGAYAAMGIVTAFVALLLGALLRDAPPDHPFHSRARESLVSAAAGVGEVLRTARIWWILPMAAVGYAGMITIRGLWGGPYFNDVFGLDPVDRGNLLLLLTLGSIVSLIVYGWLGRRLRTRKGIVVVGGALYGASFAVLAALPAPDLWLATTLLMLVSMFGAVYPVLLAHARSMFPDRLVGRTITSLNLASFSGIAIIQAATGWIMVQFAGEPGTAAPAEAYRAVFAALALVIGIAALSYIRSEDRPRRTA